MLGADSISSLPAIKSVSSCAGGGSQVAKGHEIQKHAFCVVLHASVWILPNPFYLASYVFRSASGTRFQWWIMGGGHFIQFLFFVLYFRGGHHEFCSSKIWYLESCLDPSCEVLNLSLLGSPAGWGLLWVLVVVALAVGKAPPLHSCLLSSGFFILGLFWRT